MNTPAQPAPRGPLGGPLGGMVAALFGALASPWAWVLGLFFALYPAPLLPWRGNVIVIEEGPRASTGAPADASWEQAFGQGFLDGMRQRPRAEGRGEEHSPGAAATDEPPATASEPDPGSPPAFRRGWMGALLAPVGAATEHPALIGNGPQRPILNWSALLLGALLQGLAFLALAHWAYARSAGQRLGVRALGPLLASAWPAGALLGLAGLVLNWPAAHFPLTFLMLADGAGGAAMWIGLLLKAVFLAAFGLLAGLVVQLGAHSLARNGRGVISALQHAWRLMRARPWRAVGWALPALMLTAALHGLSPGSGADVGLSAALLVALTLRGIAGVATALYFAQAFTALGGLATAPAGVQPAQR